MIGSANGQVAGDQVLVGVAHARRRQLDQHLAGLGRVELDLLDAPVGVSTSHRMAALVFMANPLHSTSAKPRAMTPRDEPDDTR